MGKQRFSIGNPHIRLRFVFYPPGCIQRRFRRTLWGNAVAGAEICVAVAGPLLGAIADQTGKNKRWLAAFTFLCVIATALLWFVRRSSQSVWFAIAMLGIGLFALDCGQIFYNAMLPRIVAPEQLGRWSGWGWAMGYAGGLVCLAISLLVFVQPHRDWIDFDRQSAEHIRMTFVFAAVWYALFSLPRWLTYWSGNQRIGMSVITLMLLTGFIMMLRVREPVTIEN